MFLAEKAAELRPDQLEILADRLAVELNPDGTFSEDYRALRRGFTWCGRQRPDGMSIGRLVATPELRAIIEALLAKFAAPGCATPPIRARSPRGNRVRRLKTAIDACMPNASTTRWLLCSKPAW